MADILPRPAGAFLFKYADKRCYGQPEKTGKPEIGAPLRREPEMRAKECQLQFQPKIPTVRFAARKREGICKQTVRTVPAQWPMAVLSDSLLGGFPDQATSFSSTTSLAAMPLYAWVCHSCHATNPAGSEACGACGCPAVASVADIEEAKTGVIQPPRLSRKQWQAQRRTEIATLPFWKKPVAYALQAMRVVGAVFVLSGIFDLSIRAGLFGFGIILVAELLFSLLKGRPYFWEGN